MSRGLVILLPMPFLVVIFFFLVLAGARISALPVPCSRLGYMPDAGSTPRLDLSHLEGVVLSLFSAGVAPSTKRAYKFGCNRYSSFCSEAAVTPFPVSESSLCMFVSKLFMDRLSSATVKSYLSAVCYSHISLGLGDPRMQSMPRLEYFVRDRLVLISCFQMAVLLQGIVLFRWCVQLWLQQVLMFVGTRATVSGLVLPPLLRLKDCLMP